MRGNMKKAISFVIVIMMICAAAIPSAAAGAGEKFTEKMMKVYVGNVFLAGTAICRNYAEPRGVPFISVKDAFRIMTGDDPIITKDGGVYTVTRYGTDLSMVYDAESGVASFANYYDLFVVEQMDYGSAEESRMVKVVSKEYVGEAREFSVSFASHGIDVIAEEDDLYIPVPVMFDLFSAVNFISDTIWSGDEIYVSSSYYFNYDPVAKFVNIRKRNPTLADFTYRELCFDIDYFYGYPNTGNPFTDRVEEAGLDAAIMEFDPFLKTLLLAEAPEEYYAGLFRLFTYWMNDGGHTGFDSSQVSYSSGGTDTDRFFEALEEYGTPDNEAYKTVYYDNFNAMLPAIAKTHDAKGRDTDEFYYGGYYTESGDTAFISFDAFSLYQDLWDDYFRGGELPTYYDTFAFVYDGIRRADENPEIKNVVFDLTSNTGGSLSVAFLILGLINGEVQSRMYDRTTGRSVIYTIKTDRNLDGRVNELDDEVTAPDLTFSVLTSSCSYSCGNYLPCIMRDAGYFILGEQSTGGACANIPRFTSDGVWYHISDTMMLTDINGNNIDDGIPVEVSLLRTDEEGNKDYSDFFDLDLLSMYINDRYFVGDTGDVNGDGGVNMKDILLLRRALAGDVEPMPGQSRRADVDGDGNVTMKDVLMLRKIIAGDE